MIPNPTRYSPFVNRNSPAPAQDGPGPDGQAQFRSPPGRSQPLLRGILGGLKGRLRSPTDLLLAHALDNSPYLVERVRRTLEKGLLKERILKGRAHGPDHLRPRIQRAAEIAVQEGLRMENAASTAAAAATPIEGGLAARRPVSSVLALVGGESFRFSTSWTGPWTSPGRSAPRSDPFIFAAAFESGKRGPEAVFDDRPLTFKLGRGKVRSPRTTGASISAR